jgi:hypothetical protein
METAVAPHALTADPGQVSTIVLRDVEDLHDADLAGVLDDRLLDGEYGDVAAALAELVVKTVPAAVLAHDLHARAGQLATH